MFFVASNAYAQGGLASSQYVKPTNTTTYIQPVTSSVETATGALLASASSAVTNEVGTCPLNSVRTLVHVPKSGSYVKCVDIAKSNPYPCYQNRIGGSAQGCTGSTASPLFQSQ